MLVIDFENNDPLQINQFRSVMPGRVYRIEAVSPAGEVWAFESAISTESPSFTCEVVHQFDATQGHEFSAVTKIEDKLEG